MTTTRRGSVVLVHGMWSNPEDWTWVRRLLDAAGVDVFAADLPSHHSGDAGLLEDARSVREVIRCCAPPVVVVGWSYGGTVISVAADGEERVARLVYVADVPRPRNEGGDPGWIHSDPHISVSSDGTFLPDNHWWLAEEAGRTAFPQEVQDHLWSHPRRPVALKAETDPQTGAAWQRTPTTVLLGRNDQLVSDEDRARAAASIADVRLLDCDHFIPFRTPEVIAEVIAEALDASQ